MRSKTRIGWAAAGSVAVAALAAATILTGPTATADSDGQGAAADDKVGVYVVDAIGKNDKKAIADTGAAIVAAEHDMVTVTATKAEVNKLLDIGYRVTNPDGSNPRGGPETQAIDERYHTAAEAVDEANRIAGENPGLVSMFSMGKSHEGRDIMVAKVSDNAGTDEDEPEALFIHNQHAREILTIEMGLYTLTELTSKYASDQRVKAIVDSTETYIVISMNPDGQEYDTASGDYQMWRKNRQPNDGSSAVGTDLNRNWDYKWGCCGGSSGSPGSETYRGAAPGSAPETKVLQDFVNSRVINGVQQIKTAVDIHSFSELVLWPYGYTEEDQPADMDPTDLQIFQTMGRAMAETNGYTPEQASDLYITDGSSDDWLYGAHKIYAFTYEMYPTSQFEGGFYPSYDVVAEQTARNREAVLYLLENSDCPKETIGQAC